MFQMIAQNASTIMVRMLINVIGTSMDVTPALAGGYLRDEVMGKPQKDMDVIVHSENWTRVYNLLMSLAEHVGFKVIDKTQDGTCYKYTDANNMIVRVLGVEFDDKEIKDMDFIIVRQPVMRYMSERFPTNASKIWSTDAKIAWWGVDFDIFKTQKIMAYTGVNYQQGYRERMQAKYPEFAEGFPVGFDPEKAAVKPVPKSGFEVKDDMIPM